MGTPPRQRKMHPRHKDCADWGPKASYSAEAYEPWIVGQVTGIRVDQATIDQVIRAVSTPKVMPLDANRARMERMKRELALDHAAGKIADETYLARVAVIRQEMAALATGEPPAIAPPDKVIAKLRQLPETWAKATPAGRVELLNSIYERITVKGREFVSARLTSDAYALGLALALPEQVEPAQEWALARPTGVRRASARAHGSRARIHIDVEGRSAWLALLRSTA